MGRRSAHTPDQLRERAICSACEIIAAEGLAGFSAREVARRIGYSPGTLYNLFENLDDLVLHVEALLLETLDEALEGLASDEDSDERLRRIAMAYMRVSLERPKLWCLIAQHAVPGGAKAPAWYTDRLETVIGRFEMALAPLMITSGPEEIRKTACLFWAGLNGISTLWTADKFSGLAANVSNTAEPLIDGFVQSYLAGLRTIAASRSPGDKIEAG